MLFKNHSRWKLNPDKWWENSQCAISEYRTRRERYSDPVKYHVGVTTLGIFGNISQTTGCILYVHIGYQIQYRADATVKLLLLPTS